MTSHFNTLNFTKPLKWLIFSLCIKLTLYFVFISVDNHSRREFIGCFIKGGDHEEYIQPIDNFFEKGIYALEGSKEPYAGRLPGFVFPYILFRAIFDPTNSNILLGIFILALSVLASYVLGLLLFNLTQKRMAFLTGFLLMNFVPFFWHYDWTIHVNSLGASCFIFFIYFFHNYLLVQKKTDLLFAGFFLCWLALLRGLCLMLIPIAILFLLATLLQQKQSFKKIILSCVLFILPFTIFETMWITRNYISLKKFVPLQTSFVPGADSKNPEYGTSTITKYSMMKVRQLIFAWGGDNTWYFNNADMAWFTNSNPELIKKFNFDNSIFFEGFTLDSLIKLKSAIDYSYQGIYESKKQDSIETVISETASRYHKRFVQNKKMYFYFYAPIKRLKNYLLINPTQDWPGPSYEACSVFQKILRLLSLLQYFLLLILLPLFPILYLKRKVSVPNSRTYLFLYLLLLANVIPFITIIYMSHYSYFIFGYIALIPLCVFCFEAIKKPTLNG